MGWWDDNVNTDPAYFDCTKCGKYRRDCRCDGGWCSSEFCSGLSESDYEWGFGGYRVRKSECNCKPNEMLGHCDVCYQRYPECVCEDEYCQDTEYCNTRGLMSRETETFEYTLRHSECCKKVYEENLESPEYFEYDYDDRIYACDVGCKICAAVRADPENTSIQLHPPSLGIKSRKINFVKARRHITERYDKRREKTEVSNVCNFKHQLYL